MAIAFKKGRLQTWNGGYLTKKQVEQMLLKLQATEEWNFKMTAVVTGFFWKKHVFFSGLPARTGHILNIFSLGSIQQHSYHTGIRKTIPSAPIEGDEYFAPRSAFQMQKPCGEDYELEQSARFPDASSNWKKNRRNCNPGTSPDTFDMLASYCEAEDPRYEWNTVNILCLCQASKHLFYHDNKDGTGWKFWTYSAAKMVVSLGSQDGAGIPATIDSCEGLYPALINLVLTAGSKFESLGSKTSVTTAELKAILVHSELPARVAYEKYYEKTDFVIECNKTKDDEPCSEKYTFGQEALYDAVQSRKKDDLVEEIKTVEKANEVKDYWLDDNGDIQYNTLKRDVKHL